MNEVKHQVVRRMRSLPKLVLPWLAEETAMVSPEFIEVSRGIRLTFSIKIQQRGMQFQYCKTKLKTLEIWEDHGATSLTWNLSGQWRKPVMNFGGTQSAPKNFFYYPPNNSLFWVMGGPTLKSAAFWHRIILRVCVHVNYEQRITRHDE